MAESLARSTFSMRTGVARLRSVPPAAQLEMALGVLDPATVTEPMLHELVHHTCANSAVNVAMQYRWLALLRLTLSSPFFGVGIDPLYVELAADLAASEAILQPLAEGLAHFGEFDCAAPPIPDDPAELAGLRFGLTDAISFRLLTLKAGASSDVRDLRAAQRAEKLSPTEVGRRADVLSHPLFPETANDAYLVGYLVAKAAWDHYLAVAGEAPVAASSFLEFLLYHVYEDWTLGVLLLRAGPDAVIDRLAARIRGLFAADLGPRVRAFIDDKLARGQRGLLMRGPEELRHGAFAGLEITTEEVRAGMREVARFHLERVGPGAPLADDSRPLPTNLYNLQHQALVSVVPPGPELDAYYERNAAARGQPVRVLDFVLELPQLKRPFGAMLDTRVECGVDAGGRLFARAGEGAGWLAVPDRCAQAVKPGRLVGVAMSTQWPWSLHCLMLDGDRVLGAWSLSGDQADGELARIAHALSTEAQFEVATGLSLEQLTRYFANALASDEIPGARQQADRATAAVCRRLRDVLADHGWAGLFGSRPAGIDAGLRGWLGGPGARALAVVGLANAFTCERGAVAAELAAQGHDLAALAAACDDLRARRGVSLLATGGRTVRARV